MNSDEIRAAFEEVFDEGLLFHGFTDYMRDYDMIIDVSPPSNSGLPREYVRYRFVDCVLARTTTALSVEGWSRSLDERLIDYQTGADLYGFVWGVKWQPIYPGFELVADSPVAQEWSGKLGIPFHEARMGSNGHDVTLVFSDLRVDPVPPGYSPFTIAPTA